MKSPEEMVRDVTRPNEIHLSELAAEETDADDPAATPPGGGPPVDPPRKGGDDNGMSDAVSRPELDAKLDALRQEMRADFAQLGKSITEAASGLRETMAEARGEIKAINVRFDGTDRRLDDIGANVSTFKWWLAGAVLTLFLGFYAASFTIQQMTVSTFQAAAQLPPPQPATASKPAPQAAAPPAPAASR